MGVHGQLGIPLPQQDPRAAMGPAVIQKTLVDIWVRVTAAEWVEQHRATIYRRNGRPVDPGGIVRVDDRALARL